MTYNPAIHHRRSIRLKGYDYSRAGAYFVTIRTQRWARLFGKIENGVMILNDAGSMVDKWYHALESKFPDIKCDEYIIMPDHFHCVIENTSNNHGKSMTPVKLEKPVGADPCVCPGIVSSGHQLDPSEQLGEYDLGQLDLGQLGEHGGSPLCTMYGYPMV